MQKKRIALTYKINSPSGGPFISHRRIQNSPLKDKYDFIPLMIPRARQLLTPFGMYKFIKEICNAKVEIVQIAGLQLDGILTMIACKMARVKTIVAIHGRIIESPAIKGFKRKLYDFGERWTINSANACFGVSDYVSSWDICKKAKNYFGTIYNLPPRIKKYTVNNREKVRNNLKIQDSDIVFISTGRIIKEKGFDILWQAIKRVNFELPIKYLIVGDGNYLQQWKADVMQSSFRNKIIFLGYQEDVEKYLNVSDAFIICTKHETLCISLLEAAMEKLPLIGTNVGGIPEIINSKDGILVENEDVVGFVQAIEKIASNRNMRITFGENAFQYVSSKFDEERILLRLDQLYEMVLNHENL